MNTNQEQKYPFYHRLSSSLLSVCLILLIMYIAKGILVPLALATIFSIVLIAPCNFLEKKKFKRSLAAAIVVLVTLAIIGSVIFLISNQIVDFRKDIPTLQSKLAAGISDLQQFLHKKYSVTDNQMSGYLDQLKETLFSHSSTVVGATFATLSTVLLYCVFVPIYTFLFLIYRHIFVNFLIKSFDFRFRFHVKKILFRTKFVLRSYVVGLVMQMVIVAIMMGTAMLILGVKYAILLALITGVLNIIPYLGIFTALLLSCLITFTTNSPSTVLWVAVSTCVIHIIDSNIVLPNVVGSKVKINSLITILAVVVGENLWGIPGMFLSVPIVAILKVIFDGVDHLKPWGYLLSDGSTKGKVATNFRKKQINS